MSLSTFFVFLIVSVVIILISLWFIRQQLVQNRLRQARLAAGEERYIEEKQKRIDSIKVLLKSSDTNELSWIEASIRIKNLLDQLGIDLSSDENVSAFYIVTENTAHIPTHEQWKVLPQEAKVKFRNEMTRYEEQYKEHLLRARDSLMTYEF